MPVPTRRSFPRAAWLAAWVALAALHLPALATPELPIVAQTCPKEGRDPSAALFMHSCGVLPPDDFAAVPSWKGLQLMAVDPHPSGGRVAATLYCMSRASGSVSAIATVKSAYSGTRVQKVLARLSAPLDFSRCGYFVRVDVDRSSVAAQALMVSLLN